MKKLLAVIAMFVIFFNSGENEDISLLDYFDGEYVAYSNEPLSERCVDLGCCYMNYGAVDGMVIGESITVERLEIASAIESLSAKVVKTEVLNDGTNVIYCFTDKIDCNVMLDGKRVNIQIAEKDEYSVIGWPLILGSF